MVAAPASRPATSGITAISGRSISASGWLPIRLAAERLGSVMRPCPSSPITPAETPAITASVKRRRWSSWLLARISSARWLPSCAVIRLKARDSRSSSWLSSSTGTETVRSPARTRSAAAISRTIGVASRLAKPSPTPTAASSSSSATTPKIIAKVTWMPERRSCSERYSSTTSRVRSM